MRRLVVAEGTDCGDARASSLEENLIRTADLNECHVCRFLRRLRLCLGVVNCVRVLDWRRCDQCEGDKEETMTMNVVRGWRVRERTSWVVCGGGVGGCGCGGGNDDDACRFFGIVVHLGAIAGTEEWVQWATSHDASISPVHGPRAMHFGPQSKAELTRSWLDG